MKYKADLERVLTSEMRKREPLASAVSVSFDGQFAIYHVRATYKLRKLSQLAREFLREGRDIETIEKSLFEG
jgi:hypothetical protein